MNKNNLKYIVLIYLICIITILLFQFKSTRITQSYHGLYHTPSIYQIVNGICPPTNILSANVFYIYNLFF